MAWQGADRVFPSVPAQHSQAKTPGGLGVAVLGLGDVPLAGASAGRVELFPFPSVGKPVNTVKC